MELVQNSAGYALTEGSLRKDELTRASTKEEINIEQHRAGKNKGEHAKPARTGVNRDAPTRGKKDTKGGKH